MIMKKIVLTAFFGFYTLLVIGQSWKWNLKLGGISENKPISACQDNNSNIYLLGRFEENQIIGNDTIFSYGNKDIVVLKLNKFGEIQWYRHIGSKGNDFPRDIQVSGNNKIYITGSFRDTCFFSENDTLVSKGNDDTFVASLNLDGSINWYKNLVYGPTFQIPNRLIVDNSENLILSGYYLDEVTLGDEELDTPIKFYSEKIRVNNYIAKFNALGELNWAKNYPSTSGGTRFYRSASRDNNYYMGIIFRDTLFVENDTLTGTLDNYDIAIIKLNFNGDLQWSRVISGEVVASIQDIAATETGVYFAGLTNSNELQIDSSENKTFKMNNYLKGGNDWLIGKYNHEGVLKWIRNGGGIANDEILAICANEDEVFFTGDFSDFVVLGNDTIYSNGTFDRDAMIGSYDTEGNPNFLLGIEASGEEFDAGDIIFRDYNSKDLIFVGEFFSNEIYFRDSIFENTDQTGSSSDIMIGKYGCLPITLTSQTSTPLPCNTLNGGDSAQISLSAEGGFTELLYSIDGGQNFSADTIFYVNTPGEYPLVVKDSTGCQVLGDTIIITQPEVFEIVSIDSADASSQGATDGSIVVEVQGGTEPYTYSLNEGTPQTDSAFTDLAQGKYKLFVQDANNCGPLETDSISIGPPPCEPISFISQTASDFTCNLGGEDSVMINLEAEGGLTGLLYSIDGGLSFAADGEFYVKQAGEYEVVVQDSTGCELLGDTLIVSQPELFTITDIDSSDASARDVSDGSIVVTVTGGTEPYEFTLNGGTPQANGGFTGLAPGKYKLSVQDANSCGPLETDSITIGPRSCVPISLVSLDYSDLSCHENNGGEPAPISIEAEGGLTGLLYSIDGGDTFAPDGEFAVGLPGEYIVMAKDSTGCEEIFDTITISQPEEFDITSIYSSDVNHHGGNEGFVLVNVVGGTLPYVFTLNGGSEQSTGSYMDLTAGKYQVQVVDDNNCGPLETDSIIIEQPPVGLKDLGVKQVNIYPNPVNEELNIEFKIQDKEEESISIMDASGKVVVNKKFKAVNGKVSERLGVSGLRNGVYFLRIGDGGEVLKIVKE